ncbi:hypothetical protein ACX40Y_00685 [Sphingomonas sp. RS6]
MEPELNRRASRDWIVALALALLLGIAWMIRDRAQLAAWRLPDTDDVMRLQQIRDWLGGQRFDDLAQHRLGPAPGLEMHWSRVADLAPGLIILLLAPLTGAPAAAMVAVVATPVLWFACTLLLVGGIARRLGQSGAVATIIAALAYPATTLFFPGRIDHHGLQMVLVLALVRAMLGPGRLSDGAIAGLATALSLAIGMETAPLLAVGGAVIALLWWRDAAGAQARMAGYAAALLLALAAERVGFRSSGWDYPACDGFTAMLWRAALIVALAPAAMAAAGFATRDPRHRLVVMLIAAGGALAGAVAVSPACLSPYGEVDPMLTRRWLAHVAEAQSLFATPVWHGIAFAGLPLAGLAAGLWLAARHRQTGWAVVVSFQLIAVLVMLAQLRGAHAAALLAAPALAALVATARRLGTLPLALAWIASAGFVYPMLGDAIAPRGALAAAPACTAPAGIARIAALPPGTIVAPVDLGAFVLAASHHRVFAAPYHRNAQGNQAMYDIFLNQPAESEAIARRWGIDYLAICPDSFDELGEEGADPSLLAGALRQGRVPAWLTPIPAPGIAPRLYRLTQPAKRTLQ